MDLNSLHTKQAAIPTATELADFIWLIDQRLWTQVRQHEKALLDRSQGREITADDARLFVGQYLGELERVSNRIRDAHVMRWMTRQTGFVKAAELAQRGKRGRNEIQIERRFQADLEGIEQRFLEDSRSVASLGASRVRQSFRFEINDWPVCVLQHLAEYIHSDHDSYFIAKSKLLGNCQKIEKLIQEIEPYLEAERRKGAMGSPKHVLSFIDRWKSLSTDKKPRNQQNKAEHTFVKRMVDLNRRFFGVPKPEVIVELMTLDCFRQQIGLRQISRLCTEHIGQKEA